MVTQRLIPLDSPGEWKEALVGIRHTFGHTWENCYAMHLTTGLQTYLYCFEEDATRIVCPVVERDFHGYVDVVKPFGFSGFVGKGECPDFALHWDNFARERGYVCAYLGLNPVFGYETHFDAASIYQYDTVYVLDLTPSVDALYGCCDSNRKRQLKHWDDIVANLVVDKPAVETFFKRTYYDFLQTKNAEPIYYVSDETLSFLFNSDNVALVGMRDGEEVVAASVFFYTSHGGDYWFGLSLLGGRKHSAALVWYGIRYLKSLGIPLLNFGGGDAGTAEFKRRFGAKGRPLRCLKQVYNRDVYEALCREANADPHDMAGYFPAYRKKEYELKSHHCEGAYE